MRRVRDGFTEDLLARRAAGRVTVGTPAIIVC
jgi:hypothetical protein